MTSRPCSRRRSVTSVAALAISGALGLVTSASLAGQAPVQQSDIPQNFLPLPVESEFDKRIVMIPMRDGIKLNTVIMLPKKVTDAPIVLDRTPYSAARYTALQPSGKISAATIPLHADLLKAGYIVVMQDVRGKHGSEGVYSMVRPLRGVLNATDTDNSTDAYDTIEWLSKNIPESNGRVATTGISYDGNLALMSLVDPHPALKASVPIDPMVDGWVGDDWFHNGAYRQKFMEFTYIQSSSKNSSLRWPEPRYDTYESWMEAGSAAGMAKRTGADKLPYWQRVSQHPAYDEYWQAQAMDRILASRPLTVPVLLVHGQWDQEDIYGPAAVYAALEPKDRDNDKVFLAIGPWNHGAAGLTDGSTLGPLKFGSDTSVWFRSQVMLPFLDAHLKGEGRGKPEIAPVTAFETGTNAWRFFDKWPQACAEQCPAKDRPMFLLPSSRLGYNKPVRGGGYSEYLSDPAKPVTYRVRPIRPVVASDSSWGRWLVDDQRFASDRPDVLTFVSDVLDKPVKIAGHPVAHLFASTSGSDSDWIVKLIDVYPDEVPGDVTMGGYQLPISMEIMRGRYRENPAKPRPVPSGKVVKYTVKMPDVLHVFRPGHRIMVQVQSSWFPLYDRNPQSYPANIMFAQPSDFIKAVQRVYHRPDAASFVALPIAAE